jgi:sulfatase maturation enzyme AslB (radical SAM superfamily)
MVILQNPTVKRINFTGGEPLLIKKNICLQIIYPKTLNGLVHESASA